MLKQVKTIFLIAFCFLCTTNIFGQQKNNLFDERPLKARLDQLRGTKDPELMRAYNDSFKVELKSALENKVAFDYPFNTLPTLGKIYAEDKQVRVFSWNVQLSPENNIYNCFVLKKRKRKDEHDIIELEDNSAALPMYPKNKLNNQNWYGALYYDIVDVKIGRKTYYTILGYDLNNSMSHIKLIDVLYFTGRKLNLGFPLFNTEEGVANRVFMEHSKKSIMTLRYDERRDKIVFDHLSPETPSLKEFREFYVPDMSYDAYTFVDELWVLESDIITNNAPEDKKMTLSSYDAKNDTVIQTTVPKKWNSPTSKNDFGINGEHEAKKVPKEELAKKKKEDNSEDTNEQKEKLSRKEKKEKFKGVQYGNLGGKKKKKRRK